MLYTLIYQLSLAYIIYYRNTNNISIDEYILKANNKKYNVVDTK
ncbi:hypothetical protein ALTER154_80203 [Alteromonas sp. 154]|nr:hypothetical protein ALTER154_80203 [Alteromonas sp. 154]